MVSISGLLIESPALFTTKSMPPKARTPASIAELTCASSVTSTATAIALSGPPSSVATLCADVKSRSAIITQAPSAPKRIAVAFPIPDPPPVTNAIRP